MGIKKYTVQIIPEDGEVKEIHLSGKMIILWGSLLFLIIATILYLSVNIGRLIVDKAEYTLLKNKIAHLENRELEIEKLNNKMKKLYDFADKLNKSLGLEISLEEFFEAEKEKLTPEAYGGDEEGTMETEAIRLQDFVPNILPTTEGWITKKFSADHNAIDISLKEGTSLYATMEGTVTFTGDREYLGTTLEILNDEGFGIIYSHLSEIMVKEGAVVKKNQLIALSGNSGRSDAPHLHYGVQMQGKWVNPIDYLLIRR
ncbi:M23 family metallopeptidase [candidate division WOR-3 bacterium]|nr:M23 family metallopeptidase [candidate division WOR-3 bacterium]